MANLNKIKYKSFTFPHNPETTGFRCDKSYVRHKYPHIDGNELEDFGVNAIVISGKGLFYGDDAYNQFSALYRAFKSEGVGRVSHPVFTQVTRGLMVSLESTIDPEENVIRYTFEIVADTEPDIDEDLGEFEVEQIVTVVAGEAPVEKKSYKVGDIVNFSGGNHYISSYASAKGKSASAGPARITLGPDCKGNGGAHPWHLIHTDNSSAVYGWVDEGTFS